MAFPVYYVEAGDVLPHFFGSYDGATGASETLSGLAVTDIEIYKDGGMTQRGSDAGFTLLDTDGIDTDGITGINGFSIDLSDNTTADFYAVGSWYHVVVSAVTIDSQTVNFIACAFRILSTTRGMAGTALPNAAADAAGGLPISDAGGLDLDALPDSDYLDAVADTIIGDVEDSTQTALDALETHGDTAWAKDTIPNGTAQTGSTTSTLKLAVASIEPDDTYIGWLAWLHEGTASPDVAIITDSDESDGTITIHGTWRLGTPDNTTKYKLLPGQYHILPTLSTFDHTTDTVALDADALDDVTDAIADLDTLIDTFMDYFDAATTEPTTVPAATATRLAKLDAMFVTWRNAKAQTADETTTMADDGTTPLFVKTYANDGTTAESGEWTDAP